MDRPSALIAGKPVFVYDPGPKTSPSELRKLLRRHSTFPTIAGLGELCGQIWARGVPGGMLGEVPLPLHAIPYLALLSIEVSNDYRGGPMSVTDLARIARAYLALDEPDFGRLGEDERAAFSFLLRTGGRFDFQRELRHQLPRIVLLLRDIWPRVEKARALSPTDDLVMLTGLDLDRLLFFGWAFSQAGTKGAFEPYTESQGFPLFSLEAQATFLSWASADYQMLRRMGAEARAALPNDTFDPYRFNPLAVFPIVRPDRQNGRTYVLPCQRLLFDRVHRGLYHLLAEHHRGGGAKENPFRSAFGYVFQEYIGHLLRPALGTSRVHGERRYRLGAAECDSVDWIVIEGEVGVLVEVKQSALSLPARSLGDMVAARADLKKTIVKAVRQLEQTEAAIKTARQGLEDLAGVREFERLVVTYDTLYFGNSFMRELVREELGPGSPHVHVCAVEDFEYLLGRCRMEGLHSILRRKRFDPNGGDGMDFKDWLAYETKNDGGQPENPFLTAKYREILRSWGSVSVL
jgi:hypothetical protein